MCRAHSFLLILGVVNILRGFCLHLQSRGKIIYAISGIVQTTIFNSIQ